MKRLGGLLLLIALLIPAAAATTIGISPDAIEPGGTITVTVGDLPDGTSFSLGIRCEFTTIPGEASAFTVRNLALPFALNSGEMSAYTRGTNWTELAANLPDGGTVIMRKYADQNGEVRIAQPCNIGNGTLSLVTLHGEAVASSITADLTLFGTKQGQDDGMIPFAIEGIEQGAVTVTAYVDGRKALSKVIPIGASPTPTPPPTPTLMPTPTQAPPIPGELTIASNKDAVTRGDNFIVTTTGGSSKDYHLFIEEADDLGPGEYPVVAPGQSGIVNAYSPTNITIHTTTAGIRSIRFDTNKSTNAQIFTIRVEDPADSTTCDSVKVKIEESAVTITTSDARYLGEEIWFHGVNTDSDTTYLFLTGPGLAAGGVKLSDLTVAVEDGNRGTFTNVGSEVGYPVDSRWSYRWNTSNTGQTLNAGNYTIYAVAEPRSRDNLSDVKYAMTDIQLRLPSIEVTTFGDAVARGDDFWIHGTIDGHPDSIQIWIIGPDYLRLGVPIVLRDIYHSINQFDYTLTGAETINLTMGRYFVVVQHPVTNGFEITANGTTINGPGVTPTDLAGLQPLDAANALIDALESPHVDDTYAKYTFTVGAPMIRIDRIERTDRDNWFGGIDWFDWLTTYTYGETITVTGTTCYPAGTTLTYAISSLVSGAHTHSGDIVVADDGRWSFGVNTTAIGPGTYIVQVMSLGGQSSASASFTVRDGVVNPTLPAGAIYRVERISVNPSLDGLTPGERATLNGAINVPWAGCQEDLGFSTDLLSPTWPYAIEVEREVIRSGSQSAGSFTLSAFDLDYGNKDVRILFSLAGTVPETEEGDPALFRVFQRDIDGRIIPNSEYRLPLTPAGDSPPPPSPNNLTFFPGWNFISIPRPLAAENDTAAIFAGVETGGRSVLRYDTIAGDWIALKEEDRITPLEGFWIYSTGPTAVPLNFSTNPLLPPAERTLVAGWNAIGTTGNTPATARDTLYSVKGRWTTLIGFNARSQTFETGIINGGSGANADTRSVYPGRGYWLHMTGPGTLCAIGA